MVDKLPAISLANLNGNISNNIKSTSVLGPFGVISSDVKQYPIINNDNINGTDANQVATNTDT